jgi:PAS domain S-box-containing protein
MNSVGASGSNSVGLVSREWRLATILPALLLVCCTCAFPLDPSLDISQYAHTAWKVRDGVPKSIVVSVAQTPDGYLWLGTESGLFRFDGVRAVPWQPPSGEQLLSNYIETLLVSRNGTLWIGTKKGLASWKDGKLTWYREFSGAIVGRILEGRDGTVWIGTLITAGGGKLCGIRSQGVQCYGTGSFGAGILALYEDRKSNLWTASSTGIWRWGPGPTLRFGYPHGILEANSMIEDDDGTLLLATSGGLKQLAGEKIQDYSLPGIAAHFRPSCFFRSRDGSLWIGSTQGLLHRHRGRVDVFRSVDGLSGDFVIAIFEDREGNVWVSTSDGFDRFRSYAVPSIGKNQGLSGSFASSVQAAPDGSIWIGTSEGLNRWASQYMTVYRSRNALTQDQTNGRELNVNGLRSEIAKSGLSGSIRSLGLDESGRLWISAGNDVFYRQDGRFVRESGIPGGYVTAITADSGGNIWVLTQGVGLFHRMVSGAVHRFPESPNKQKSPLAMLPDEKTDGLWLGFVEGGIAYLREGQTRLSYNSTNGLGSGTVNDLRHGPHGVLWVATEGGLSRILDEHITTLTGKNGLPCDNVLWSIEDDNHGVWLYMPCGLVRIEQGELDAWVKDPARILKTRTFDTSDGVRTTGDSSGYSPHVTKSPDGRIWFTAVDGVSLINPQHLPVNNLPPPVHIEQIVADDKPFATSPRLRLPSRIHDLTIDYTALSLTIPEKVRFRVKLEGQDTDWRELVNERRVHYTNLPPRHYRFRVIAANNSGVWNEIGDSLDFEVPPAWYQTMWFRAICIAAFMTLLWAVYQLRVNQLREQEKKFREAVETMPALAFLADSQSNRTFLNRGWLEYTGLRLEEALGSGWMRVIHPDDLPRVIERWRASQMTGQLLDYEVRIRRGSDGVYRWFQTRARPLRDSYGKIEKWCAVLNDIEDRKQAERLQADVTHANRVSTMGELVASISHELAQPITVTGAHAKASLRWLQRDPPNLAEALTGIPKIIEASTLAAGIIDRLRSLYKKAPPKRECLAINEVITDMIGMLRSEARTHGVSLRTDLRDNLPMTVADRVQLQQVLMNLMLNGIEAMNGTGGVLTVKSQLNNDCQIEISVNDTGPGLSHDKADQIFDAFFTTKPQGSGMGLAICRSIVESHGGRIWANGNGGRGATFHFTLPAAPAEEKPPTDAA